MANGGRLSYSTELVDQICARLAVGETLAEICANPPWPKASSVQRWINNSFDVKERFARAREIGEDYIASNTRKIARGVNDLKDFQPGTSEQRDKLVVDTDLRLLAFWNPKKYSERKQLDMNVTVNLEQLIMQAYAPAIEAPVIDNEEDGPLW